MSYPPNNNFDGYPPYGSQQPPYPGSQQPGVGFTPYPAGDGAGGMPQFPGQGNFGNNSMPGFNLPQQQNPYPPGGGGGGPPYQNYNASNPPYNVNSNSNFSPYGQQQTSAGGGGPHSGHYHSQHQQHQQPQSYQPFSGNNMTSSYGQSSNSMPPQQQQHQQRPPTESFAPFSSSSQQQQYPNLPSFSSNTMSSSTNSDSVAVAEEPIIRPTQHFNAQNDADLVHKAMKGFGTDEKGLIKVLCHRTSQERSTIAKTYKQMFGKELVEALRGECNGKFGDLMVALATPADLYDAEGIYRAIEGMGTDEDSLVEILCTRSNNEILALKAAYTYRYKRNIEHDVKGDTRGHFERLLVSLLNGGRDESTHVDQNRAAQTAQELYNRGEKMFGTDESYFNSVLAAQSLPQLRAVCNEYRRVSGKELEQSIASEMSGDLRMGMVSLVKCIRNPAVFFAEQLHKSMQGMGTNDHILIRVLVTRCDKDLGAVKREFHRLYRQPLENMVKGDTSGDYESGLLALCGAN